MRLKAPTEQIQRGALREGNLQSVINIQRSNYLNDAKISDIGAYGLILKMPPHWDAHN